MISFAIIVDHVKHYMSCLHRSAMKHFNNLQSTWTMVEAIHTLRQIIHLLILLTLLGLTIYLLPADPQ